MNETSVAVSSFNPQIVVAAWNYVAAGGGVGNGFAVSLDGGGTWTEHLQTGVPGSGDPMTGADPRTGTLWVGADNHFSFWTAKWNNPDPQHPNGWFDAPVTYAPGSSTDKPFMAAGPRINQPNTTRLYVSFWTPTGQKLAYSDDLGSNWKGPVILPKPPTDYFISTVPRVGPNGELYIFTWDRGYGVYLVRSLAEAPGGDPVFDAPIKIATRLDWWNESSIANQLRIPGNFNAAPYTCGAVDPVDGTLYCVYHDTTSFICTCCPNVCAYDIDIWFAKSTDHGTTWTTPKRILGDDIWPYDQFFPWLEVSQNHRLDLVFFDTRGVVHADYPDYPALLRTQYAWSTDGGTSWSEATIAPNWTESPPPPSPAVWRGSDQWYGEYIGLAATSTRVIPVYPAGRGPGFNPPDFPYEERIYANPITWP